MKFAVRLQGGALTTILLHILAWSGNPFQVEFDVTWTRWTPLTRLAINEDKRGTYMLLDNTSASEVVLTEQSRTAKSRELARSLVYRLHDPPARVAILAASAGPEASPFAAHLLHLSPKAFDELCERYPRLGLKLYRNLGKRVGCF